MKKTLLVVAFMAFAAPAYGQQSNGRPPSPELRANWAAGARLMAAAGPRDAVDVGREAGEKAAAVLKGRAGRLDERNSARKPAPEIERRGRAAAAKAGFMPAGAANRKQSKQIGGKGGGVKGSADDFVQGYAAGFAAAVAAAKE